VCSSCRLKLPLATARLAESIFLICPVIRDVIASDAMYQAKDQAIAVISWQASAQRLQARAQAWQWSMSCLAHSSPQAPHASAHSAHRASACSLPRAIKAAAVLHRAAQSMSSAMQRAMALTSGSRRQEAAQVLQAAAQRLQASMQSWYLVLVLSLVLVLVRMVVLQVWERNKRFSASVARKPAFCPN
jgi:cobalamin biosynthesis Mg chelatase CobN